MPDMESEIMEDVQNELNQDGSINDEEVRENVSDVEDANASDEQEAKDWSNDPYKVKKRLGMQAKRHAREMREMQQRIAELQSQMAHPSDSSYEENPYHSPGQPNAPSGSDEERIQKAVRFALDAKDAESRKADEAQKIAHVQRQYERLNNEFDKASDKYEDFDDVVRDDSMPFTAHMRDALLLVDNPADVAYRLGKNRSELERISKLHPLDQAREVNKLAFALMGGNGKAPVTQGRATPMGSVKVNPANTSSAVTDKTPPSVIRARMKAGTWK